MGKIYLRVFAGLGNQQFQYAFAKSLALKYNKELILDNSYFLARYHPIKAQGFIYPYKLELYDIFEKSTNIFQRELVGLINRFSKGQKLYQFIQKLPILNNILPCLITQDNFDESIFAKNKNVILSGYFQKYSFFNEFGEIIQNNLTYKEDLQKDNKAYLMQIQNKNSISIHIRRGDYIEKQNIANNFARVTPQYFKNAIKYIDSLKKIEQLVIFSDDIQWVKDSLVFDYPSIYIENDGPDYEHQFLMSQCTHNIISNSTFSWWASWLNSNEEKIVCVPKQWFAKEDRKNDIYISKNWIRIEN